MHVTRVALLDCLPISEHLDRAEARFATAWWHWFFFAQPDRPERVITADPDAWYRGDPTNMGEANYTEWRTAMRDPALVRDMLEDYRAGLTVDDRDERADRATGRRMSQPLLILWPTRDDPEDLYRDPRIIWRDWADNVTGPASTPATTWPNSPQPVRRAHAVSWFGRCGEQQDVSATSRVPEQTVRTSAGVLPSRIATSIPSGAVKCSAPLR